MQLVERPIEWFVEQLDGAAPPLVFSRWGDGEWHAVFGSHKPRNCDGHPYSANLTKQMQSVLTARPPYLLGLQPLAVRLFGERIDMWLEGFNAAGLTWCNADVFHRASIERQLAPLIQALHGRHVLFVGPQRLHEFAKSKLLAYDCVDVPLSDAFSTWTQVVDRAVELAKYSPVIAVSAGPPAKLIVHRLWELLLRDVQIMHMVAGPGLKLDIVDFGSLWDPYAGFRTRKYMTEMTPADWPPGNTGILK